MYEYKQVIEFQNSAVFILQLTINNCVEIVKYLSMEITSKQHAI